MKVFVLGGDGFCGWPCAVNLADQGHDVLIVDNLSRRKIDVKVDYVGFTIPDQFVIGYGLDYGEAYRNLRYVGVLRPEVYSS